MRQPKILTTLKTYDMTQFTADLIAGISVAMVALPLSLAIAIASGADPAQGLVMATFMAGFILLIAGYFRAGRLIAFVPEAVVNGFTIGIAVIIATSQIKDFFGPSVEHLPAEFLEKLPALWAARDTLNLPATGIALLAAVLIVALRRIAPRFPGLIVAVGVASALVALMALNVDTIHSRFGDLPSTLPAPRLPDLSMSRFAELFPSAVTIAFLAGVESLLSAMVADRMIGG